MEATMAEDNVLEDLRTTLRGQLIEPEDGEYASARKLYNGMIDKRPGLIARCADVADVISAVNFGRDNDLLIAIRGGGHNGPGLGSCDGGMVIDLSPMKGVHVNPDRRTVRVEPGCTQGDMDHATHAFGLAVPAGIVSTTGVGGLTLGGGHGYLSRQHGLTIDNLIEADVVLADGRFATVNDSNHKDLFWALRGGGGNFGVVTRFTFRAHPVKEIFGGLMFWDAADARTVMRRYREFLPMAPETFSPFLGLKTVPGAPPFPEGIWGRKICAIISCYNGTAEKADEVYATMRDGLPEPIFEFLGTMPFPTIQSLFDSLLPSGLQWYWKGDFIRELSDTAIDVHIEHAAKAPTPLSLMHLYPIDGAVNRIGPTETAWNYRDATWSMVIAGIDPDPSNADALKTWAKAYWEALQPHTAGGAYVNFMMEEGRERIKATYGDNYARLVDVKKRYDPNNLFRVNQNIQP
jgi:FAD/FMN-containing dehydrogenase